jgi:hypothetical protein
MKDHARPLRRRTLKAELQHAWQLCAELRGLTEQMRRHAMELSEITRDRARDSGNVPVSSRPIP